MAEMPDPVGNSSAPSLLSLYLSDFSRQCCYLNAVGQLLSFLPGSIQLPSLGSSLHLIQLGLGISSVFHKQFLLRLLVRFLPLRSLPLRQFSLLLWCYE